MEIVFAQTAMAMSPLTLSRETLGGSETAVMMAAQELSKKEHDVTVFTPLPPQGRSDYVEPGYIDETGVRWLPIENYANFIGSAEVDLLVVCRDPRAIATSNQAKKRVLWMHDIATHRGMKLACEQMQWVMDEIWTVSEWHRQQVHSVTGYPLKNIVALRNGIVPVETIAPPSRLDKMLCYAARPERGLENLIKPGGVMEHLPDYTLKVSFYRNTHENMREFYDWCYSRMHELHNVEMPDELPQTHMRQRLQDVQAYIYPTQFEETSCILARECMSLGTPFLTTEEGALPETLGDCGIFFEKWARTNCVSDDIPEKGSPDWCKMFADFVRDTLENRKDYVNDVVKKGLDREDIYWDGVADMMIANAQPKPVTDFSRAWSLMQDGDVIPAYHFLLNKKESLTWAEKRMLEEIEKFYPFILPEDHNNYMTLSDYYKEFYAFKDHQLSTDQRWIDHQKTVAPRFRQAAEILSDLPDNSLVVEYGCGEGHYIVPLAQEFPNLRFVAFDQVQTNVDHVNNDYEHPGNLEAYRADTPEKAKEILQDTISGTGRANVAMCVEVLEHCVSPWDVIDGVEAMVEEGGTIIINTPTGPWEPQTWEVHPEEFHLRNHIWHFDKQSIKEMFRGKPDFKLVMSSQGQLPFDCRAIGNYLYSYTADHKPVNRFDPMEKALRHRSRQSVAAAVISYNNEDTIVKMLNSLDRKVQIIQIAHGPSTDNTLALINAWAAGHPHIKIRVLDAPKIAAPKRHGGKAEEGEEFGFDDARNRSAEGLEELCDWMLWIDTDETLVGDIGVYVRENAMDGYLLAQHHFTVEPRGGVTQIDRPARLIRTRSGYKARGHIHEHFEVSEGGPGHCHMLPNVDLFHTGYENEEVRQGRFYRNFPFLCWEHEEHGKDQRRKIHAFLWFRDIVHRMRYCQKEGDIHQAMMFAHEANDYFLEHKQEMANFGAGLPMAMAYISEVRMLLEIGVPMKLTIGFDDRSAPLDGLFLNTEELYEIMDAILKPEYEVRSSRYY